MAVVLADTKKQYVSDENLEEKSVKEVVEWTKNQPHLPNIHEIQAVLFLQKVNYNIEDAKKAVDTYFTFKTYFSEIFLERNPLNSSLQKAFDVCVCTMFPKKTPEGYSVYLLKPIDSDINNYDVPALVKYFDMVASLHLHQEGASKAYIILLDFTFPPREILSMLTPHIVRPHCYNLEEIIPWTVKSIHFFNTPPFISQVLDLIKPFFGAKVTDNLHVHTTVDELVKYVPRECLSKDYGGPLESVSVLHERIKKKLAENIAFFNWEDQQTVDESKRTEVKNGSHFENTMSFKNWEID